MRRRKPKIPLTPRGITPLTYRQVRKGIFFSYIILGVYFMPDSWFF